MQVVILEIKIKRWICKLFKIYQAPSTCIALLQFRAHVNENAQQILTKEYLIQCSFNYINEKRNRKEILRNGSGSLSS